MVKLKGWGFNPIINEYTPSKNKVQRNFRKTTDQILTLKTIKLSNKNLLQRVIQDE